MKKFSIFIFIAIIASFFLTGSGIMDRDLRIKFGKVPATAVFRSDSMSIWCGSMVRSDDGKYHLYYSRWPKAAGWAWVTHSIISHAIGNSPFGPFTYHDDVLPVRGAQFWDGLCTHNPTIHKFGNKYYLYYMGNTGDGVNPNGTNLAIEKLNYLHRNNQRIGVAIADNPNGPWQRFNHPLIDVSADSLAPDALMTSNPAVTQGPDGTFLMIYKAVGRQRKMPSGGPVVHMAATSNSPAGPFKKHKELIFTVAGIDFPAEDPFIWYQAGKYRAIVKSMVGPTGNKFFSLVQYESTDGLHWNKAKYYEVSDRTIEWANGRRQQLLHLERPQLFFEGGKPVALLCAADTLDAQRVRQTFNIQIPVTIEEL